MPTEVIEGTVEHITYSNPNNGYTVCDISSDNAIICAVGCMPSLVSGETVRLTGQWVNNPSYGEQFSVTMFERLMPKKVGSILMYLSSGIIKGVKEATAKKIVEAFGAETLDVIAQSPLKLSSIKGISTDKAMSIHHSFIENQSVQNTIMFLQPFGVTVEIAMKAHKTFGSAAVLMIKENPYILCDKIQGIGFDSVDSIARSMNIELTDKRRVKSGIKHLLLSLASSLGHTYIPEIYLTEYASRSLDVDENIIENCYVVLQEENELYSFNSYDEGKCYQLAIFKNAEHYIASRIHSLSRKKEDDYGLSLDTYIKKSEEKNKIKLSSEQKNAVKKAVCKGITIITGGPGTGKTTIIRTILDCLDSLGKSYVLSAPTGRAAKRMTDSCTVEAKTIHRLLEIEFSSGNVLSFSRSETNPIDSDYIIVDEMSMVDTLLMKSLISAVSHDSKLILLGDSDQLPSVGAGSVLKDIISSGNIDTLKLTHIYRQAAESMIVTNAHRINNGQCPFYNKSDNDFFLVTRPDAASITDAIVTLCSERLPKAYGFSPLSDIQIVTPVKKSLIGVYNLNSRLQEALNPPHYKKAECRYGETIFREGDKVMQTENNYNLQWTKNGVCGNGVFNGDMGIIETIDKRLKVVTVLFDDMRKAFYSFDLLSNLSLSYAITVHKSQGSEFECIIMPVYKCAPMLMTRNLFYTAVTRAKSLVVLVGLSEAAEEMVLNNSEQKRYSGLIDELSMLN